MSKNRDYTRYSKVEEPAETVKPVVEEAPVVEPNVEVEIQEPVIEEPKIEAPKVEVSEPVIGVVTDCARLNLREHPNSNSEVLAVIVANTELVIIEEESTEEFYKVCTSVGLEGYCMKKFVTIMP